MRAGYGIGPARRRRRMKEKREVLSAAFARELEQFIRKERGWLMVWDEDDKVTFAHHWLDHKPVIHKGRKS